MLSTCSVGRAKFPGHSRHSRDVSAWTVTRPNLPSWMRSTLACFGEYPSGQALISPASGSVCVCDLGAPELTVPRSCHGKGEKILPVAYGPVLKKVPD